MKRAYILACSTILVSVNAYAQTPPSAAAGDSNSSSPAEADRPGLDDIVVTAQRREQRQKDVPLTITTVSGSDLTKAGVTSISDLQNVVSGFTFSGQGTVSQPSIRGVSTSLSAAGSENPNALYVDGIYQATQAVLGQDLADVERIEVLKGPQGTLFGRNATGGAIQVFTRQPSFTRTASFSLEGGSYTGDGGSRAAPHITGRAFVSVPIIDDVLAVSLSGGYSWTPGFLTNDTDGTRTGLIRKTNLRGKILLVPADNVEVTVSGYYIKENDQGLLLGTPFRGLSAVAQFPDGVVPSRPWHVAYDLGGLSGQNAYNVATLKQYGGSLKIKADFEIGSLTSLTGYNNTRTVNFNSIHGAAAPASGIPGVPAPCLLTFACIQYHFVVENREVSQELNFASRDFGPLSFVAGLFYYNAKGSSLQKIQEGVIPGGILVAEPRFETTSYAAYGEATLKATSKLSLIAGLRYNHEPHYDISPGIVERKRTFNSVTPRFAIKYELTDQLNVYGTYSVGYKSGLTGVTNVATGYAPVNPEKIISYEAGIKYAERYFTVNLSGFYYDYKDKQEQTFLGTSSILKNTGPVRIYGFDFDSSLRVNDFRFRVGATWIPEAKYRDFPDASARSTVTIPFPEGGPLACNGGGCGGFLPGAGPFVGATFDATGGRLIRTPKFTANGTLSYEHEFGGNVFDASATISYSSRVIQDLGLVVVQPSYATLASQAGFRFGDSGFRLGVYGRNLTNKKVISAVVTSSAGFIANYSPPREVGVVGSYAF